MNKVFKTTGGLLLTLILLLSMSVIAFAGTQIDVTRSASLTLKYVSGSTALSGADFRLYKAAEISGTNLYTLTDDFADYSVSLENLDSAGWLNLAATLAAYAARDGLEPLAEGFTNSAGTLTFDKLSVGLYLVAGEPVVVGNDTYTPTPFLVSLPNPDTGTDEWKYDVTAEVKYDREDHDDDTTCRTVVKVWKGDDGENRPDSVTVQLLRNETVYDEVTLNEKNGWKYTWEELQSDCSWRLVEKNVPEGYTVSVSLDGLTFTVTNTCKTDIPDNPDEPDTPNDADTPDTPNAPDTPDDADTPDTPYNSGGSGNPGASNLPQTGQLWWPVPLLAGCGLTLFALGWVLVFLERKKDA